MAYWCPTSVKIIFMTHKRVTKIFSYGGHTPIVNIFRSDVSPIVQFFVVASSVTGRLLGVFTFFTVFVRSI